MKNKKKPGVLFWILVWVTVNIIAVIAVYMVQSSESREEMNQARKQMKEIRGINRELTGSDYDAAFAVTCDNGIFLGQEKNGVMAYKGIPFAEKPINELRWKPPVDASESSRIFEAYYFGKSGIQTEAATERASFNFIGEDCLTLNIWCSKPKEGDVADGSRKGTEDTDKGESTDPSGGSSGLLAQGSPLKPVMVFFPGGAYGWGGTADPLYDGQNFLEAHKDVVLVTANYRIGLMGFMDFSDVPGSEGYEKSGNLGLLDQISALRWVQRNIKAFGGDPDNVTIFGESAGASSVSLLPLIDEAKGLFKRAIAESGSIAFTFSKEEAKNCTEMLMERAKANNMQDLLNLSEKALIRLNKKLNDYNNFPVRDGIVLPEDVYKAYEEGKASWVEMLSGTNSDETRYWIDDVGGFAVFSLAGPILYNSILDRFDEDDLIYTDAFMALQKDDDLWNMTEFLDDLLFRVPAVTQAGMHAKTGGTHYMYYWTKPSELSRHGACHAVELAYVFNNLNDTIYTGAPADEKLAKAVQEMWVNFAKTGDPSTEEYTWEKYDTSSRKTMILGDTITLESDPLKEQRVLVEPFLKYRINGYYMIVDYALMYLHKKLIQNYLWLLAINGALAAGVILLRWRKRRKKKEEE